MNYLSVCSGIEAATVAWHDMGWKPVGFSEIEKFPAAVLADRYQETVNYGDFTGIRTLAKVPPVDVPAAKKSRSKRPPAAAA